LDGEPAPGNTRPGVGEVAAPAAGGCADIYICPDDGQCFTQADRWSETAREAFEWCYENNPMCFISAEGCMLDHLYPSRTFVHRAAGSGFELPDGTAVGILLDQESATEPTKTGTMSGGAFALELTGTSPSDIGTQLLVWVDNNGDGVCSEGDGVSFVQPVFNGDFDDPLMVAEFSEEDINDASHLNCVGVF
jgi:hypothetical protein